MAALWNYRASVTMHGPAARIPTGVWVVQPLDAHTSQLDAGALSPELLAAYLGALDLDFHIDPDHAPELARATDALTRRYVAAHGRQPGHQ